VETVVAIVLDKCRCGRADALLDSKFTGQERCSACRSRESSESFHSSPEYLEKVKMEPAVECPICGLYSRRMEGDYICWRCRKGES
jgi:hypothetical protein